MSWRSGTLSVLALLAGCAATRAPLADLHPVVWAHQGRVELRSCRWPDRARIEVGVAEGATPAEEAAVDRALSAWSAAGLGLRLERSPGGRARDPRILVRFVDVSPTRGDGSPAAGLTVARCRWRGGGLVLTHARVEIGRVAGSDLLGRARPLDTEERLGVLIHELGHALGHPGHRRAAEGELVRAPEAIRRVGHRIRTGGAVRSRALVELYAQPSGLLLREARVAPWRTEPLDQLAELAERMGFDGPVLESGDRRARIYWVDADGVELGLWVPGLGALREHPEKLLLLPEAGLRRWLRRARSDRVRDHGRPRARPSPTALPP